MARQVSEEDVAAFMRQLKLIIGGIIALFVLPLILYAVYLGRRLDEFADTLRYRPPQQTEQLAAEDPDVSRIIANPVQGQMVYVPAYSHIYHEDGEASLLTVTLSVRNTSIERDIVVRSVRYFDTNGKQVKSFLDRPLRLGPLATTEFLVEREDTSGGSGANFLVEWLASEMVSEPILEAVMIDTDRQQGISFARQGVVVRELTPDPGTPPAEPDPGEAE